MPVITRVEHGIEYRHEELPEGWTAVDVYEQCHTVVPDQGGVRALELKAVLEAAGITACVLTTYRKRASVLIGSGPGGSAATQKLVGRGSGACERGTRSDQHLTTARVLWQSAM
jgi:hypothetical protein